MAVPIPIADASTLAHSDLSKNDLKPIMTMAAWHNEHLNVGLGRGFG